MSANGEPVGSGEADSSGLAVVAALGVAVAPRAGVGVGVEEYSADSLFEQPTRNDTSRLRRTSRHRTNMRESDFGFMPDSSRIGLTRAWRWRYECVMGPFREAAQAKTPALTTCY